MKSVPKILAIDDNASIAGSMRFIFAAPLYELTSATDGNEAILKLSANPKSYDIIIVDQKMPHLSGLEVVQEIRNKSIAGQVIVLSAHLSPEIRDAYEQMGVSDLMDKPFDVEQLRSTVHRLCA